MIRIFSVFFAVFVTWVMPAQALHTSKAVDAKRPNTVFVMADDIAYDNNFGAYGA